jgi:hypothetical protein
VDIEPGNAHVLDGNAADLVAECRRFEDLIHQAGGVHLFIGGAPTFAPYYCLRSVRFSEARCAALRSSGHVDLWMYIYRIAQQIIPYRQICLHCCEPLLS